LQTRGKQTQFKANQSQYKPNTNPIQLDAQMNAGFYLTKDYENKPHLRTPPKQTQSNPIFTKNPHPPSKNRPKTPIFTQFRKISISNFFNLQKTTAAKSLAQIWCVFPIYTEWKVLHLLGQRPDNAHFVLRQFRHKLSSADSAGNFSILIGREL